MPNLDYTGEYYCPSCFHTEKHEEKSLDHRVECPTCGAAKLKPSHYVTVIGQCIKRCGGKDKLSKWEEILHRPRGKF